MIVARIISLCYFLLIVLFSNAQQVRKTISESHNESDLAGNEYLQSNLKPIRENFKRINSILKWTSVVTKENNESTEGGETKFYYLNGLQKIIVRQFGETFQNLKEYYLLNGNLSFVLEKSYKYNRPIYYDSTAMKENDDTTIFDMNKSEIVEIRSYFLNGKLIHQINNQDCGSPFYDEYLLGEQKRITSEFASIRKSRLQ
ncbi:MAG TPA: hypothetical protein VIH86_17745 [Puia sp.]